MATKWRREYEPYELFVCEQAAAFADKFETVDALVEFAGLPYAEQRECVPEMSDEHSGNTFAAAVRLAQCMKSHEHRVEQMHGALCPLVGCEAYRCWSTTVEEETSTK